jgi:hypothetical protein
MPRFRLILDHPVDVYQPAGGASSLSVEPGDVVEAPGVLGEELVDAYVVGTGDDARAWPKALWELDKAAAPAASAVAKEK